MVRQGQGGFARSLGVDLPVRPFPLLPLRTSSHLALLLRRILRRELRTSVETSFAGPAYLGEEFPVSVEVKNEDEVDVQVFLVIFLQPSDDGSGASSSKLSS